MSCCSWDNKWTSFCLVYSNWRPNYPHMSGASRHALYWLFWILFALFPHPQPITFIRPFGQGVMVIHHPIQGKVFWGFKGKLSLKFSLFSDFSLTWVNFGKMLCTMLPSTRGIIPSRWDFFRFRRVLRAKSALPGIPWKFRHDQHSNQDNEGAKSRFDSWNSVLDTQGI